MRNHSCQSFRSIIRYFEESVKLLVMQTLMIRKVPRIVKDRGTSGCVFVGSDMEQAGGLRFFGRGFSGQTPFLPAMNEPDDQRQGQQQDE